MINTSQLMIVTSANWTSICPVILQLFLDHLFFLGGTSSLPRGLHPLHWRSSFLIYTGFPPGEVIA